MPFSFYQNQNRNTGNPDDNGPQRTYRSFNIKPKLVIIIAAAIVLIGILSTCFFVVDQTQQAVVLRFGCYERTVGPGLQMKLPLGIEKNYNVETQVVQTMTFGFRTANTSYGQASAYYNSNSTDYSNESIMLTGDLNIIDVEWIVQYRINDPYAWLFNVQDHDSTIHDVSRSIINQLVGDLPILSIMTDMRTAIEVEAEALMQDVFDRYNLGVKVVTVKLQNIVPPEGDVADAFEDVNKAVQDMNRYINEGKESYNAAIPEAQGEAEKEILVAQGYAAERVNQALGDVARFTAVLSEYEKAKSITATRLYIEMVESVLANAADGSITVVDKTLENFLPIANLELTGGAR